jgi:hypothetical protein
MGEDPPGVALQERPKRRGDVQIGHDPELRGA